MSPEIAAIVSLGVVILLILLGCHVAVAMGGVALIFGFFFLGANSMLTQLPYSVWAVCSSYPLIAVPLFIFMGALLQRSEIVGKAFDTLYVLLGGLRGGLALSVIFICILFGACTGVAGAAVITMGLVALPVLLKYGYDKRLVAGTICAGGDLGVVIPPSIVLILYGAAGGVSIANLFTASIIPGIVLGVTYMIYIWVRCSMNPALGPALPPEERKKVPTRTLVINTATVIIPVLALIVAVLGSIMIGLAAPTEAASMGAVGALIICAAYRRLTFKVLKESVYETIRITSMAVIIVVGAKIFQNVFLHMGGARTVQDAILGLEFSTTMMVVILLFINFIMGMFMDWIGIIYILVPIYAPIVKALGVDPLWFGTIFCITLQISYMTPPFAYSVFFLKGVAPPDMTLGDMYRGAIPFVILQVIGLALFIAFPILVLWLPAVLA
jgi:tripartite ATP-independent transporter DctM subunit